MRRSSADSTDDSHRGLLRGIWSRAAIFMIHLHLNSPSIKGCVSSAILMILGEATWHGPSSPALTRCGIPPILVNTGECHLPKHNYWKHSRNQPEPAPLYPVTKGAENPIRKPNQINGQICRSRRMKKFVWMDSGTRPELKSQPKSGMTMHLKLSMEQTCRGG